MNKDDAVEERTEPTFISLTNDELTTESIVDFEPDSLGPAPDPPSGFNDPATLSDEDSSSSSSSSDSDTPDDDEMIAQRGTPAPVLAGPMKFSIGSYKDRSSRDRNDRALSEPENESIPSMPPVPESPPPPPPVIEKPAVAKSQPLPKLQVRTESIKLAANPVKFEALLLPEKPVFIIPKSPSPIPPPIPSKPLELRKSVADLSDVDISGLPPPPLPLKSETLKRQFSSHPDGNVSPSFPKPNVPARPAQRPLSSQVIPCQNTFLCLTHKFGESTNLIKC